MRVFLVASLILLSACRPRLEFNDSQEMTRDQMLTRADHVFIGVVENREMVRWPWFRFTASPASDGHNYWRVLRRRVRVENVLLGTEPRKEIDIYEIHWFGGTSGDWNSTRDGERDLFLVRFENGYYHITRDWWRSILPVVSGPHSRLPMDDLHPFWDRVALLNWWIEDGDPMRIRDVIRFHYRSHTFLNGWRTAKIERGLLRHPNAAVREAACQDLAGLTPAQEECLEQLPGRKPRGLEGHSVEFWWATWPDPSHEIQRLLTTVNDHKMRAEFCRLYERDYPGDRDNGCPGGQPPPATIVTENGDVPLIGP